MKMLSIILAWLVLIQVSFAQQNIQKLNVDQLKLPKETTSRATIIDATGTVRSSSTVDDTELSYIDGVTSPVQTQINSKQATITGAASSVTTSNLSNDRAVISDGSGKITNSAVTATELGYVSGTTSSIQTQLNTNATNISGNTARITTLEGYDKVLEYVNFAGFPGTGATATLYLDKALNKLYRWNGSSYALVGDGTGTGDVVGPASATDTAIAIYDGATGKLIKNSTVTINASGDISANSISAPSTSTTSTLSGVIVNNSTVKAVTGANLDLDAVSATSGINLKKKTTFWGRKLHTTVDDASTGSNVTLADHAVSVVRLTGSGLVSVDGIPAGNGADTRTIINMTGADVFLNNDTGATAANRFYTGTGSNLKVKNNSAVQVTYDTTNQRWYVTSGAGAGGISPWATATSYKTGDVIYTNDKIYVALADHTSGTFSSDLGTAKWKRLSDQFTVSNEAGTQQTIRELRFPKNQVTQVSSDIAEVESGNRNRLVNPGFEHQTPTTGWTSASTGTATLSTTANALTPINGWGTSMTLGCAGGASGGTCSFYQDVSTSKKRQFVVGLDLISDTATGVKVYSRVDGVKNKTLDIKDTVLEFRKIPEMSGTTSTGVLVEITVAASQSILVQVDDANVGVADFRQDMSTVGPWIDYGTMTIAGQTASPTKGTNDIDKVRCRVVGQDYECEYNYRQNAAGSGGTGDYIFSLPTGLQFDSSRIVFNNTASYSNVDTYTMQASVVPTNGKINQGTNRGDVTAYAYSATQFKLQVSVAYSLYTVMGSASYTLANTSESFKFTIKFPGAGLTATSSSYMTQNSNTGYLDCGLTSSAFTAFGTVTNIALQCRRRGEELDIKGKFTSTSPAASEARLALPLWSGNSFGTGTQLVSKGTQFIPSTQIAGAASLAAVGDQAPTVLIDPSVAYVNFGFQGASGAGLTKQTGSGWLGGAGTTVSIKASIPIETWDETNFAIANISGLESCTDSYQCTGEFSAKVSSTDVVSDENLEWITNDCTNATAGRGTCTYKTGLFTVTPNCTINAVANSAEAYIISQSASAITYETRSSAGNPGDSGINISCQKTGADAVFKNARAVAGDQNDKTPGLVNKVTFWADYGATANLDAVCTVTPCLTTERYGQDWINGNISRSGSGAYGFTSNAVFAPNTYVNCTGATQEITNGGGDGANMVRFKADSTGVITTSSFPRGWNSSGTLVDTMGTLMCEGQAK